MVAVSIDTTAAATRGMKLKTKPLGFKSKSSSKMVSSNRRWSLCGHSIVLNGVCTICHHPIPQNHFSIAFDYIARGLRLTTDEINCLKAINTRRVLSQKKLHLVLDLDHTLLHTKFLTRLTPDELYLKEKTDLDTINGSLFSFGDMILLKLRPFVRRFLEEASGMFEMFVCSKGSRDYVSKAVEFLDPQGKYFEGRLIAREDLDASRKKDLNLVLGEDRCVVVVDDTPRAWRGCANNLVAVKKYLYFRTDESSPDASSFAEMGSDESAEEGELVSVLGVLRRIHADFFQGTGDDRDVRSIQF